MSIGLNLDLTGTGLLGYAFCWFFIVSGLQNASKIRIRNGFGL